MWFEAMSRLRINLSKSDIIAIGPIDNVEELASEIVQSGIHPYFVFRSPSWGSSQRGWDPGRYVRKILKEVGFLEKTVHI